MLPSSKGISLGIEQWEELMKVSEDVNRELGQVAGVKGSKKVKK